MKTTIELPDELLRSIKVRAAEKDRKIKDVMAELLRIGLAHDEKPPATGNRVRLPLVECAHPAQDDQEMTPDRVAAVLLADEAGAAAEVSGATG